MVSRCRPRRRPRFARDADSFAILAAGLSDDEDESDDEAEDDPVLTFRAIPHQGCVNRIRARPLAHPLSAGPPAPPNAYHVATFSETGKVHIFDVAPHLHSLLSPASASGPLSKVPVFTIDSHGRAEGYALDWGLPIGSSTSGRLLSGDINSKIFLTTMTPTSFTPSPKPFLSHTDSVEDLQWSPTEPTVFASCSADKSVRVWDIRVKDRKSVIGVAGAHESDVNVISWNRSTNYLLASGGDEGAIKVWDLRNFKGSVFPVLLFATRAKMLTRSRFLQHQGARADPGRRLLVAHGSNHVDRVAPDRGLVLRCFGRGRPGHALGPLGRAGRRRAPVAAGRRG